MSMLETHQVHCRIQFVEQSLKYNAYYVVRTQYKQSYSSEMVINELYRHI